MKKNIILVIQKTIKIKKGQRFLTSRGMASMGWDLPSSIGASVAGGKKRTICVTGDGSIQMNLQELETIKANNLPIKIFVFDNGGYLTIKNTQKKYFEGNLIGCDKSSSLNLPDLGKIALAYGIPSIKITKDSEIKKGIVEILKKTKHGIAVANFFLPQSIAHVHSRFFWSYYVHSNVMVYITHQAPHLIKL